MYFQELSENTSVEENTRDNDEYRIVIRQGETSITLDAAEARILGEWLENNSYV